MASDMVKGTALRGPNGEVAIRTGPAVAAGQFFVFDPDNGGYYAARDDLITQIEKWPALVEVTASEPTAPAAPAATS